MKYSMNSITKEMINIYELFGQNVYHLINNSFEREYERERERERERELFFS